MNQDLNQASKFVIKSPVVNPSIFFYDIYSYLIQSAFKLLTKFQQRHAIVSVKASASPHEDTLDKKRLREVFEERKIIDERVSGESGLSDGWLYRNYRNSESRN